MAINHSQRLIQKVLSLILACLLFLDVGISSYAQSVISVMSYGVPSYPIAAELTQSTLSYLNQSYQNATELDYGSAKDKKQIKTVSDTICQDCHSDAEKANSIAKWVKWHIQYENPVQSNSHFMLNVLNNHSGQCMGFAETMRQSMRAQNIPAVLVIGIQEDTTLLQIKDIVKTMQKGLWHAFVMAYYDGTWHLFDPIHRFYDLTDANEISKHFLICSVEGVSPRLLDKYPDCFGINRIVNYHGKSFAYAKQKKWYSSVYSAKTMEIPGTNINGKLELIGIPYLDTIDAKYCNSSETFPKKNELFSNGWFTYQSNLYHAKPNGILYTNTYQSYQGKWYYLDSTGQAISVPSEMNQSSTWEGLPLIQTDSEVIMRPYWDSVLRKQGWNITYCSQNSSVAEVDNQGTITAFQPGTTEIVVTGQKEKQKVSSVFSVYTMASGSQSSFIPYQGKKAGLIFQSDSNTAYFYRNGKRVTNFTDFCKIGNHYYYIRNGCWQKKSQLVWKNHSLYWVKDGIADFRFFHHSLGLT